MPDEATLLDLVGRIHDAALDPGLWPGTLERVGDAFGAATGHVSFGNATERVAAMSVIARIDPALLAAYNERYLLRPDRHAMYQHVPVLPVCVPLLREAIQDDAAYARSGVYGEVIRPGGYHHIAFACLFRQEGGGGCVATCSVMRGPAAEPFDGRDLELLGRLIPHLQRAVQVRLRLGELEAARDAREEALDRLPLGVALVDAAGKVLFLNRSAADLVARRDGLTVRDGALRGATSALTAALAKLVAAAARTGAGGGLSPGGALALPRPSGLRPLSVLVAPLRGEARPCAVRPTAAVVFVSDPERREETPGEVLARLYGLTRREAAVAAALLDGQGLADAADRLGVGLSTAKAHLRRVFDKTDTHQQAELVRLVLGSPAGLRFSDDRHQAYAVAR